MSAALPRCCAAFLLCFASDAFGERLVARSRGAASQPRAPSHARRHLPALFALSGLATASAQSAVLQETMKRLDKDNDGEVDAAEFKALAYAGREAHVRDDDAWREVHAFFSRLFDHCDINGDGKVNLRELEYAEFLASQNVQERTVQKVAQAARNAKDGVEAAPTGWIEVPDEFGREYAASVLKENDKDGDGKLSREEYNAGMRTSVVNWGWESVADSPDVLRWYDKVFAQGDLDENGSLDVRETHYIALLVDRLFRTNSFTMDRVTSMLYEEVDENRDHMVDKEEVERRAAAVREERAAQGLQGETWSDVIFRLFDSCDADGDGRLSEAEVETLALRLVMEA
mmetsp:Transcript_68965/g.193487  ORF Transcript_68965/g.193487 Transcript_68965/m.193487 type:complete len:344 (-) Transcript_68965:125-1156(-)